MKNKYFIIIEEIIVVRVYLALKAVHAVVFISHSVL